MSSIDILNHYSIRVDQLNIVGFCRMHQVENCNDYPDADPNPPPGRLEKYYSPQMTIFDLRSADSSERASILEQRRKVRRPNPNDDNVSSLGSYTRAKPIPIY